MKITYKYKYLFSCIVAGIFLIYGIRAGTNLEANKILFFLAILWTVLAAVFDGKRFLNLFRIRSAQCYIIFLGFFVFGVLMGNDYMLGFKYAGMYFLYLVILWIFEYYCSLPDEKYLKLIFNVSFLSLLYYAAKAIIFYISHQGAARILAGQPDFYGDIAIGGGYQIAFLASIICGYLLLRIRKRRFFRILLISGFLWILILFTQSTITIMASLAGCCFSLISVLMRKFSNRNRMIILSSVILMGGLLLGVQDKIGEALSEVGKTGYSPVLARIAEIGNILRRAALSAESATESRMMVYRNSIDIIKSNCVFGELFTAGVIPGQGKTGGHSEILDAISRWGIVFGSVYLLAFFFQFKRIKRILKRRQGYIFSVILLMLLNPCIGFSFCAGLFFLIPSMEEFDRIKKDQEDTRSERKIIKKDKGQDNYGRSRRPGLCGLAACGREGEGRF